VAPHDSLGSNLVVQVKGEQVMRVLPRDNDDVNECWLSDRDRFSYEGLGSEERLTAPMVKRDGEWEQVEWQEALELIARELKRIGEAHGARAMGALATPQATLEELHLLQKLARGLGSDNVDFRLRLSDFSADADRAGVPWLGMPIAALNTLDRVLVVGSTLRKEQPLIAQRLRMAVKKGAKLCLVNPVDDELLTRVAAKSIVAPSAMAAALGAVVKAAADAKGAAAPAAVANAVVDDDARAIAEHLVSGQNGAIFLGALAANHPQAAQLHRLAQELGRITGAKVGFLGDGGNAVGGHLANAVPGSAGKNVAGMLAGSLKAYLLLHAEMDLDTQDSAAAIAAMQGAEFVVAMSAYRHKALEYAQVLLPVAPFTETAGTFVNIEGRAQSFQGVVRPLGEARPAWKVLRVLGTLMGVPGFEFESIEQVRAECLAAIGDIPAKLSNEIRGTAAPVAAPKAGGVQRIGEVRPYHGDSIVRRAQSLQATRDAQVIASLPGGLVEKLGLKPGDSLRISQSGGAALVPFARDDRLPENCVRFGAGFAQSAGLGPLFGEIMLERVASQEAAAQERATA
jgi:NADH-quinone oxidoreductase subunit G